MRTAPFASLRSLFAISDEQAMWRVQSQDDERAFAAPEPPPDKSLVDQERSELVRGALMQLSEAYRTVLVLRHYENLKFREIAGVLEVPEGTVKSRMAEALTQMGRLLKPMLALGAKTNLNRDSQPKESLMI